MTSDSAPMNDRSAPLPDFATKRSGLARCAAEITGAAVSEVETHGSVVVLAGDTVWKMKKPVRLPFVDLRRLDARERLCREEVRLNRALAGPGVYRGVAALTLGAGGALGIDGGGAVVEWLVVMRRLDAAQMLDRRLAEGPEPGAGEIRALADRLVRFYRGTERPPEAGARMHDRWCEAAQVNAAHLTAMSGALGAACDPDLFRGAQEALDAARSETVARGAAGLVVEGHGDLRPEHVCLERPPVIFDRLEFDPDLRLADPFEECAYLGLECARWGSGWIGAALTARLVASGLTPPSAALTRAYAVNRLLTRARLAIDHLLDPAPRTPEKWPAQARAYLAQASEVLVRGVTER